MKVFIIPSWYPSERNPIYGTFVHEQVRLMANQDADFTFGVSTWGQGDPHYLLWARQPIRSLKKLVFSSRACQDFQIEEQLTEFFTPAFTWSRKIAGGNLAGIIQANKANFQRFTEKYGKPDILHVQASYPGVLIAAALHREFDIPYVVTIRMSPFPFAQYLKQTGQLVDWLHEPLAKARMLIATSHSLADRLKSFGFDQVTVVHNPIDPVLFRPNNQVTSNGKWVAVGRLVDQKGFDLMINAMTLLPEDVRLDIIGEGEDRQKLTDLINAYGLQQRVTLMGEFSRSQLANVLPTYKALVMSSRHETFGNVLLEAMACGVPVVATDCGGTRDIITPEIGILCDISPESIAEAVNRLESGKWDTETIRQAMIDRFSPELFTQNMKRVYELASK